MPPSLAGKRVLVVGAGRSGVGAARLAAAEGAEVTLTDARAESALGAALAGLPPAVRRELGAHRLASFESADLVVLSPGVPPSLPEIAAAQQKGVAITGEIELASRYVAAPIVAVTGTNGKSTVTSLAGEIARATGRPAFVGGNLGTPLSEVVGSEAAAPGGLVVCEVSSFQLETADTFHPRAAVLLNLTPDHLDRHGSMEGYADAKMRIARNLAGGDVLVVNEDDPLVMDAWARHGGDRLPTLGYTTLGRPRHGRAARAGVVTAADVGGFVDGAELVVRLADAAGALHEERYPSGNLALVGRHNLGNALAAILAMRGAALAAPDAVRAGCRAFRPLAHRMELAGERGGVRYYDDSKGTNVAAVVASIDGFPRPFVLIAGGRDKGGSYAPLREALARNPVRAVVVIGEAADRIASALEGAVRVERAATLPEAVAAGARLSAAGDAVILSPACSSYDMFTDYQHRGRVFRAAVEALP